MSKSDNEKRRRVMDYVAKTLQAIEEISAEAARDLEAMIEFAYSHPEQSFHTSDLERLSRVMNKKGVTVRAEWDDQLKDYKSKVVNVRIVIEDA